MSTCSASRQIQQLEGEPGLELFQRGSRPVRLTEAGRLLLQQATQVLERVEDIKLLTRQLQADGKLHLSIGFVGSTLYGYLPEVIRSYRAERPRAELNLVELTTMEQILALKEHRVDVGFGRKADRSMSPPEQAFRSEPGMSLGRDPSCQSPHRVKSRKEHAANCAFAMTEQLVIMEKTRQANDVRAAVGGRYSPVLPAEGHLFDLQEPEDAVPAEKRWTAVLLRPDTLYGTRPASGGNKVTKLKAIRNALRNARRVWLTTDCDHGANSSGRRSWNT